MLKLHIRLLPLKQLRLLTKIVRLITLVNEGVLVILSMLGLVCGNECAVSGHGYGAVPGAHGEGVWLRDQWA